MATAHAALRERIDAIEAAYEFFLAYAAQGLDDDQGSGAGAELRQHLDRAVSAVTELPGLLEAAAEDDGPLKPHLVAFGEVLTADARAAGSALAMVAALPSIGSQVVDNLNASIHLRALLTDLFLLDETLPRAQAKPADE